MDISKIIEYQKKDAELFKIENQLAKSEYKKNYQDMISVVKKAQEKSSYLENQAGLILKEFNMLNKTFEENNLNVEKLANKNLSKLSDNEFDNLTKTIGALTNNLNILEKKILQIAEKLNVSLNEFDVAKKNYGVAKAKYTENKKKYDELVASKQPETEKIKSELLAMEKSIDAKLLAKYKQNRQDKIFPVFAPLSNRSCGVCMLELSSVEVDKVKNQGYLECENCHRIIYFDNK